MILFVLTILINALWQPACIAGVTWLILRVSRCNNATTRHAIWVLALVAGVTVPVASAVPAFWAAPEAPAVQHAADRHSQAALPLLRERSKTASVDTATPVSAPSVLRPAFRVHPTIALGITAAWLVAAFIILGRLAVSFMYLERLKRDALPLSIEARRELVRWDRAEKGDRDVRICVTDEISVPIAVGIFDAMILLPSDLVHELDAHDLDRILLHELAHVRRADDWINLFERVVQALFFFSPGLYVISRQIDLEREVACDDWVLAQTADNVPYARCLAKIVEMTQWPHHAVAAPGVFVTRKSMSIRIERLLARGRDVRVRLAIAPSMLAFSALAAIVIVGALVSPTLAYTIQSASFPVHPAITMPAVKKVRIAQRMSEAPPHTAPVVTIAPPAVHVTAAPIIVAVASPHPVATPKPEERSGYLDELAAAGYRHLTANEVVELRALHVDAGYILEIEAQGFDHPAPRDLAAMKALGVDPAYIRDLQSSGLTGLSMHDLAGLKAVGVDSSYVSELAHAGYAHLDAHQYLTLRSLGIDGAYIQNLKEHGMTDLSVEQLVRLKAMGIHP